jgi:hypothetical protein
MPTEQIKAILFTGKMTFIMRQNNRSGNALHEQNLFFLLTVSNHTWS